MKVAGKKTCLRLILISSDFNRKGKNDILFVIEISEVKFLNVYVFLKVIKA